MLNAILNGNLILVIAAIVPAAFLMYKVYKSDKLEKESPKLLGKLILGGVLSSLLALVEEIAGEFLLGLVASPDSMAYKLVYYFLVVALAEESSKYIALKVQTWKNSEFNCSFDGVVYAVFVSLGFAAWENINYVIQNGFGNAIARALTAVPGHASFGVFMGVFYGMAKRYAVHGGLLKSKHYRRIAILVPVLIHGAYDYIATSGSAVATLVFFGFIIILFICAYVLLNNMSKNDSFLIEK